MAHPLFVGFATSEKIFDCAHVKFVCAVGAIIRAPQRRALSSWYPRQRACRVYGHCRTTGVERKPDVGRDLLSIQRALLDRTPLPVPAGQAG
jgi:hypothetical protein